MKTFHQYITELYKKPNVLQGLISKRARRAREVHDTRLSPDRKLGVQWKEKEAKLNRKMGWDDRIKEASDYYGKKKSYLEVGHDFSGSHLKGKWKHPHIELYTKAHGKTLHKTPLSDNITAHDEWDKANKHVEDEKVHANGRIDHKKKEYSAVVHVSASKREPHPSAIRKAYDDVHKHMSKKHPDYEGHEQGHQFY